MDKKTFLGFFEEKIKVKIIEFCDKINKSDADLYILMARKAACFVNALEESSLITLGGKVISERLLDTEINWTGIKRIIIIDDVIISGTTLNRTINKLKIINPNFEIKVYVIGINERWFNEELLQNENGVSYLDYPIKPLENSQCIKLSGDIVRMLSIFPMPYNIDFPVYQSIKLNESDYEQLLNVPGWEINNTSSLHQKKNNVFTLTFIPNEEHFELSGKLFHNELIRESLLKIRIYGRKSGKKKDVYSFSFVPMAIFPPMKEEQIILLFEFLAGDKHSTLADVLTSTTSKLRFIQFLIADRLAGLFISEIDILTRKNVFLLRSKASLRLLFPEDLILPILEIAETQSLEVDLKYTKQEILVKNIENPYPLDDYVNINNALTKPFLDIYYDSELLARKQAFQYGKSAFDMPEYKDCIDRLNKGYSLKDLDNILHGISKEIRIRILSSFLDRAIDNGIVVPITVTEGDIVYRAFRHGEDVQFGQREERLCLEMINAFSDQVKRTDFQKIWIEKLLVFFLKIGENTFLEPIQTEINNYHHINGREKNMADVASVKYYLQGPVVVRKTVDLNEKYNFSPCLDFSDKAHWLSKYFLTQNKTLQTVKDTGRYSFNKTLFKTNNYTKSDHEIVIDKELIKDAVEIGSIFGQLINNSENKTVPSIDSDELVALSCCCEPKDIIGALAAEINIIVKVWSYERTEEDNFYDEIKNCLIDAYKKTTPVDQAIKILRRSPLYRAINDGQRKFDWYLSKYPKTVIDRISSDFTDIIYKGIWEGFWSPNLDWTESSESKEKLELAKIEGIWILCANIYYLMLEYTLLSRLGKKEDSQKVISKITEYHIRLKFYASHPRTGNIISYTTKFLQNKDDVDYIEAKFNETIEKIDQLIFSARIIVKNAEDFFTNIQAIPEISYFNNAIYIELETPDLLKKIDNLFLSICFRISKTNEDNNAVLRSLPNYDNIMEGKKGKWFIGSGKGAKFWLTQFAQEIINNLGYAYNYKIFILPDLPSECVVKIVDDTIKYNNYWIYVEGFREFIQKEPYQNGVVHTIRETTFKLLMEELERFDNFYFQKQIEIGLRLPNLRHFNIAKFINKGKIMKKTFANIGILTIVTEETQAVLSEFNINVDEYIEKENRMFYEKDFVFNKNISKKIVLLQSLDQGNISIANAYQSLIRNYDLEYVVLLGIAGSIQEKVSLCDVIIATNVIYYEKKKDSGKEDPERRAEYFNVSFRMNQILNLFFTKHSEPAIFDGSEGSLSDKFGTYRGPIGAGETVVADPLSKIKEWLLTVHSKTGAIETEAAGFCKAVYETNLTEDLTIKDTIILRGISDHADFDKDDKWRLPASKNAVIVLKKLLELLYK